MFQPPTTVDYPSVPPTKCKHQDSHATLPETTSKFSPWKSTGLGRWFISFSWIIGDFLRIVTWQITMKSHHLGEYSGQIIATSHDLTPKCSWGREMGPLISGKSRLVWLVNYNNLGRILFYFFQASWPSKSKINIPSQIFWRMPRTRIIRRWL